MKAVIVLGLLTLLSLSVVSGAGSLRIPPEQLFRVNGSWVPAEDLKAGDRFVMADGRGAVVRNITTMNGTPGTPCYGLVTDGPHDFFANGILSRDSSTPSAGPPARTGTSQPSSRRWDRLIESIRTLWQNLIRTTRSP